MKGAGKNSFGLKLVTFIVITVLVYQNIAWAKGPGMLMPDNKQIMVEFMERFSKVKNPDAAWQGFISMHPSFIDSLGRLTSEEKARLKRFIRDYSGSLPHSVKLIFSNLLGGHTISNEKETEGGLLEPRPGLTLAGNNFTVLLVEDTPAEREKYAKILKAKGYTVITMSDGIDALRFLETAQELPSVILTDYEMTLMDGLTIAKEARKVGIDIPIIIHTKSGRIAHKSFEIAPGETITVYGKWGNKSFDSVDVIFESLKSSSNEIPEVESTAGKETTFTVKLPLPHEEEIEVVGGIKESPTWSDHPDYKHLEKGYATSCTTLGAEITLKILLAHFENITKIDLQDFCKGEEIVIIGPGNTATEIIHFARKFPGIKKIHVVEWLGSSIRSIKQELDYLPNEQKVELKTAQRIKLYHHDSSELGEVIQRGKVKFVYLSAVLNEEVLNDREKVKRILDSAIEAVKHGGVIVGIACDIYEMIQDDHWLKEKAMKVIYFGEEPTAFILKKEQAEVPLNNALEEFVNEIEVLDEIAEELGVSKDWILNTFLSIKEEIERYRAKRKSGLGGPGYLGGFAVGMSCISFSDLSAIDILAIVCLTATVVIGIVFFILIIYEHLKFIRGLREINILKEKLDSQWPGPSSEEHLPDQLRLKDDLACQDSSEDHLIIDSPIIHHGLIYDKIKRRSQELDKKIMVFNVDAHTDKYYSQESVTRYQTWARDVEREGYAIVLHIPSYWDGGFRKTETNWNRPEYRRWLLEQFFRYKDEIGEIWVTIDYDFFSLFTEIMDDDEAFIHPRVPIYNLDDEPGAIDREIIALVGFLESNNIKIKRVVPAESRNYLNIDPANIDSAKVGDFISRVTGKIIRAFSALDERQNKNLTCGTICESGHEGAYNALDEQLKRQFEELKEISGISEDRDLTEEEADRALVKYAKRFGIDVTYEELQEFRGQIKEADEALQEINIFFSVPEDGTELFWVGEAYAGGHYNRAGTRIHISLPIIIKRGIRAGAAIAKHELAYVQGKGHGKDEGMKIVRNIVEEILKKRIRLAREMHRRHKILTWKLIVRTGKKIGIYQEEQCEVPYSDAWYFATRYKAEEAEQKFKKALDTAKLIMDVLGVSYSEAMHYVKIYGIEKAGEKLEIDLENGEGGSIEVPLLIIIALGIIGVIALIAGLVIHRYMKNKETREEVPEQIEPVAEVVPEEVEEEDEEVEEEVIVEPAEEETVRRDPIYKDYEMEIDGADFYDIRGFILKTLHRPEEEAEPLDVDPRITHLNEMINKMCKIIKRESRIDIVTELPGVLRDKGNKLTVRIFECSETLFRSSVEKPGNCFKINRQALIKMQELGVEPIIICFLITVGLFYEQVFVNCFSGQEEINRIRGIVYSELISKYKIDVTLLAKALELIGWFNRVFVQKPEDISVLIEMIMKYKEHGGKDMQPHLEKAIEMTLGLLNSDIKYIRGKPRSILLREELIALSSPHELARAAGRNTSSAAIKRIDPEERIIMKAVEYFRRIREHNIYSFPEYIWAPAAIFWHEGAKVLVGDGAVHNLVVLPIGTTGTKNTKPMGMAHILSRTEGMKEEDVIGLAGRILDNNEYFVTKKDEKIQISYIYKEGEDTYELRIIGKGYIVDLMLLWPYRTSLSEIADFSAVQADKLALIINGIGPLDVPESMAKGAIERINKIMESDRREFPVEVFYNAETKDIYIYDVRSGDTLIIDKEGQFKDFIRKVNIAVFFADLDYRRISEQILNNYKPESRIRLWTRKADVLRSKVNNLKINYDSPTVLAIVSWGQEYIKRGVLQEGMEEQLLVDYIVKSLESGRSVNPGSHYAPVKIYQMPDESVVILNKGWKEDERGFGYEYIRQKACWKAATGKEVIEILSETLNNYQYKEEDNLGNSYIYLKGNNFYSAIINQGSVIRFSKIPYYQLGLYGLGICGYQEAFAVSDIVNNRRHPDLSSGQEQTVSCLETHGGDVKDRKVYYEKAAEMIHVVNEKGCNSIVIDTEGNFMELKEKIRHRTYHRGGSSEIKTGFQDVTAETVNSPAIKEHNNNSSLKTFLIWTFLIFIFVALYQFFPLEPTIGSGKLLAAGACIPIIFAIGMVKKKSDLKAAIAAARRRQELTEIDRTELTVKSILEMPYFDPEILDPTYKKDLSLLKSYEIDDLLEGASPAEQDAIKARYIERFSPLVKKVYGRILDEDDKFSSFIRLPGFWKGEKKHLHVIILTRYLFEEILDFEMDEETRTIDRRFFIDGQKVFLQAKGFKNWIELFKYYKLKGVMYALNVKNSIHELLIKTYPWAWDLDTPEGQHLHKQDFHKGVKLSVPADIETAVRHVMVRHWHFIDPADKKISYVLQPHNHWKIFRKFGVEDWEGLFKQEGLLSIFYVFDNNIYKILRKYYPWVFELSRKEGQHLHWWQFNTTAKDRWKGSGEGARIKEAVRHVILEHLGLPEERNSILAGISRSILQQEGLTKDLLRDERFEGYLIKFLNHCFSGIFPDKDSFTAHLLLFYFNHTDWENIPPLYQKWFVQMAAIELGVQDGKITQTHFKRGLNAFGGKTLLGLLRSSVYKTKKIGEKETLAEFKTEILLNSKYPGFLESNTDPQQKDSPHQTLERVLAQCGLTKRPAIKRQEVKRPGVPPVSNLLAAFIHLFDLPIDEEIAFIEDWHDIFYTPEKEKIIDVINESSITLAELTELLDAFSDEEISAEEIRGFMKDIGLGKFPPGRKTSIWKRLPVYMHRRFVMRLLQELETIRIIVKSGQDSPLIENIDKGLFQYLSSLSNRFRFDNLRDDIFKKSIGRISDHLLISFYHYYETMRDLEAAHQDVLEYLYHELEYIPTEKKKISLAVIEDMIREEFERCKIKKGEGLIAINRICRKLDIEVRNPLRNEAARLFFTHRFYELLQEIRQSLDRQLEGIKDEEVIKEMRKQALEVLSPGQQQEEYLTLYTSLNVYYRNYKETYQTPYRAFFAVNKDKIREIMGFDVDYNTYIQQRRDFGALVIWLKGESQYLPGGNNLHIPKYQTAYLLINRDGVYIRLYQLHLLEPGDYWMSYEQDESGKNKFAVVWQNTEKVEGKGAIALMKIQLVKDGNLLAQKINGDSTDKRPVLYIWKEKFRIIVAGEEIRRQEAGSGDRTAFLVDKLTHPDLCVAHYVKAALCEWTNTEKAVNILLAALDLGNISKEGTALNTAVLDILESLSINWQCISDCLASFSYPVADISARAQALARRLIEERNPSDEQLAAGLREHPGIIWEPQHDNFEITKMVNEFRRRNINVDNKRLLGIYYKIRFFGYLKEIKEEAAGLEEQEKKERIRDKLRQPVLAKMRYDIYQGIIRNCNGYLLFFCQHEAEIADVMGFRIAPEDIFRPGNVRKVSIINCVLHNGPLPHAHDARVDEDGILRLISRKELAIHIDGLEACSRVWVSYQKVRDNLYVTIWKNKNDWEESIYEITGYINRYCLIKDGNILSKPVETAEEESEVNNYVKDKAKTAFGILQQVSNVTLEGFGDLETLMRLMEDIREKVSEAEEILNVIEQSIAAYPHLDIYSEMVKGYCDQLREKLVMLGEIKAQGEQLEDELERAEEVKDGVREAIQIYRTKVLKQFRRHLNFLIEETKQKFGVIEADLAAFKSKAEGLGLHAYWGNMERCHKDMSESIAAMEEDRAVWEFAIKKAARAQEAYRIAKKRIRKAGEIEDLGVCQAMIEYLREKLDIIGNIHAVIAGKAFCPKLRKEINEIDTYIKDLSKELDKFREAEAGLADADWGERMSIESNRIREETYAEIDDAGEIIGLAVLLGLIESTQKNLSALRLIRREVKNKTKTHPDLKNLLQGIDEDINNVKEKMDELRENEKDIIKIINNSKRETEEAKRLNEEAETEIVRAWDAVDAQDLAGLSGLTESIMEKHKSIVQISGKVGEMKDNYPDLGDLVTQIKDCEEDVRLDLDLLIEEQQTLEQQSVKGNCLAAPALPVPLLGPLAFVAALTWQNNRHLIYIREIWEYLKLRIRKLGLENLKKVKLPFKTIPAPIKTFLIWTVLIAGFMAVYLLFPGWDEGLVIACLGISIVFGKGAKGEGPEGSIAVSLAELDELDETLMVYNTAMKRSQYKQSPFNKEQMERLINRGTVYVLKVGDRIKGVILTYPMMTEGDLSKLKDYPLWERMMNEEDVEKEPDTILFWAILTVRDESTEGLKLGQIFMEKVKECFDQVPYLATFSPLSTSVFAEFINTLRQRRIPEEIIREYGIYLYLSSLKGEGFEPYLNYILTEKFVTSEEFISILRQKGNDPKFLDLVQNFHVAKNGAMIAGVIPYKKGYSRPNSPCTIVYGYKGFENSIKEFGEISKILDNNNLPADWPGLIQAMRADGVIDEEDFRVITAFGKAVEEAAKDTTLNDKDKALLAGVISIGYLTVTAGLSKGFRNELWDKLDSSGYRPKADIIFMILAGMKKQLKKNKGEFKIPSSYAFIDKLERLLGYEKCEIFGEIGVVGIKPDSIDVKDSDDDPLTKYWEEVFGPLPTDSAWIYTADGEKPVFWHREELEEKAHNYLKKAGKQGRIKRVWGQAFRSPRRGHGSKNRQFGPDLNGVIEFLSSCADKAGLPCEEMSIGLVDPEDDDEEVVGFSHLKDPKQSNLKAALTAVGGRFPYEGSEELTAEGKTPYTIYLRSDDVAVYKGLGEEGEEAFVAKLAHEYKDAQRKINFEVRAHYSEDREVSDLINRQEENVLRIKRLLKNKLMDYLLHSGDYFSDYLYLWDFINYSEFSVRNGIFRKKDKQPDWIVIGRADKYAKAKLGVGIRGLIKRSFSGDTGLHDLIRSGIEELSGSSSHLEKTDIENVYILLRAVEILNKDKNFMKELHSAVYDAVIGSTGEEKELLVVPGDAEEFLNEFDPDRVSENGIDPFLIWPGKKKKLLPYLKQLFPRIFNRYFEPFLGSGAVFFHCRPEGAVLNDGNYELINIYTALRDEPEEVIRYLEEYLRGFFFGPDGEPSTSEEKEDYYLCVRALPYYGRGRKPKKHDELKDKFLPLPRTRAQQAARLIFLDHTCLNGLPRFNRNGDFNVPFGRESLSIARTPVEIYADPQKILCRKDVLLEVSSALQNIPIYSMDYEEIVKYAKPGDFIYLDPPYYFGKDYKGFTQYRKSIFKELEQWRLAKVFNQLHERGCYVMLSNYNNEFIRKLYNGFNISTVKVESSIARTQAGKKKQMSIGDLFPLSTEEEESLEGKEITLVEEVIITNFVNEGSGLIARGEPGELFGELEKQKNTMTNLRLGVDRGTAATKLKALLRQKQQEIESRMGGGAVRAIGQAITDLETFDIKEFNAIVLDGDKPKSKRRWLLGFNSLAPPMAELLQGLFKNPTLGYCREALNALQGDALLEYLLHEALCRHSGHQRAREIQEILFSDTNYRDAEGEQGRKDGPVTVVLNDIINYGPVTKLYVVMDFFYGILMEKCRRAIEEDMPGGAHVEYRSTFAIGAFSHLSSKGIKTQEYVLANALDRSIESGATREVLSIAIKLHQLTKNDEYLRKAIGYFKGLVSGVLNREEELDGKNIAASICANVAVELYPYVEHDEEMRRDVIFIIETVLQKENDDDVYTSIAHHARKLYELTRDPKYLNILEEAMAASCTPVNVPSSVLLERQLSRMPLIDLFGKAHIHGSGKAEKLVHKILGIRDEAEKYSPGKTFLLAKTLYELTGEEKYLGFMENSIELCLEDRRYRSSAVANSAELLDFTRNPRYLPLARRVYLTVMGSLNSIERTSSLKTLPKLAIAIYEIDQDLKYIMQLYNKIVEYWPDDVITDRDESFSDVRRKVLVGLRPSEEEPGAVFDYSDRDRHIQNLLDIFNLLRFYSKNALAEEDMRSESLVNYRTAVENYHESLLKQHSGNVYVAGLALVKAFLDGYNIEEWNRPGKVIPLFPDNKKQPHGKGEIGHQQLKDRQKQITDRFVKTIESDNIRANERPIILAWDNNIGIEENYSALLTELELANLGNVHFIRAEGEDLQRKIEEKKKALKSNADVVLIGKRQNESLYDVLKDREYIYIMFIDDGQIAEMNYMPILEILTFALNIVYEEYNYVEANEIYREITGSELTIEAYEEYRRSIRETFMLSILLNIPPVVPIGIDRISEIYELSAELLTAA